MTEQAPHGGARHAPRGWWHCRRSPTRGHRLLAATLNHISAQMGNPNWVRTVMNCAIPVIAES